MCYTDGVVNERVIRMFSQNDVGKAVKLHPATDWWMRGATTGTIVKVGRKLVHVRLNGRMGIPLKTIAKFRVESDLIEMQ